MMFCGAPGRFARVSGIAVVLLVGTVTACSDEGGSGPSPAVATNEYLAELPLWSEFSPELPDRDEITAPASESVESVDGVLYACTSSPYSITRTPDKIVTMDPDVNILWLGALLQGQGYKEGIGSLAEWSVKERAPLRISLDLLNGDNAAVVESPDLVSVNQAIGTMVQGAEAGGHAAGSSISYSMQKTYSLRQAVASVGGSSKWLRSGITASLGGSHTAKETTITAYFVQRMFTASISLPSAGAEMFSGAFTPARLQQERDRGHVGSGNIPVYVANIAYGRSLLFTFTSTSREDSVRAALVYLSKVGVKDTLGRSDSLDVDGRYLNILRTARVGVVALGGEAKNATALIQSGKLGDYFTESSALTSARPISYTVRNLGDNSIAKVSETNAYNLKECAAIPTTGRATIDVTPNDASVSILGPGGYSFGPETGDQLLTELVPGGYAITVSRAGYQTAYLDISVAAGDALSVPVTLQDSLRPPTGAIYTITPKRLTALAIGCTGQLDLDMYHSITVNGKTLTNRPQHASLLLRAGEWDDAARGPDYWHPVKDTVWFAGSRKTLSYRMRVDDDDGIVNPADLVADKSWSETAPNITTGTGLYVTAAYNGCSTRFSFEVTKDGDIFSPAPVAPKP